MRVGVARETAPGERRVALVPETVGKLAAAGFEVVVEPGAGEAASFPDDTYATAGASLGSPWDADAVVKVRKPDWILMSSAASFFFITKPPPL